ncbi:MAG: hypothetical protein ACI9YE_002808, partial [Psychroserpens sp.]
MNYANKTTLIVVIFLVSLVQLSYGNTLSNNFENENLFSSKKSLSIKNFYDSYQTNWKNLENFNIELAQSSIENMEPLEIGTPAIEVDNCESILSTVDYVNFSESMSVVAINETDQSDNYQGCCYSGQPQGHLH